MPINFRGILEGMECPVTQGDHGENITIRSLTDSSKFLRFKVMDFSKWKETISILADKEVEVDIELEQSSFGIYWGELLNIRQIQDEEKDS